MATVDADAIRAHDLAGSIQAQDYFIAIEPHLRHFHDAGNYHRDVTNRIPFTEDGLSFVKTFFAGSPEDQVKLGGYDFRKKRKLLGRFDSFAQHA